MPTRFLKRGIPGRLFGREREKKELAKVFQALRIEVNQEMEALKEMPPKSLYQPFPAGLL